VRGAVKRSAWAIRPASTSPRRTRPGKIGRPATSVEVQPAGRSPWERRSKRAAAWTVQPASPSGQALYSSYRIHVPGSTTSTWRSPSLSGPPSDRRIGRDGEGDADGASRRREAPSAHPPTAPRRSRRAAPRRRRCWRRRRRSAGRAAARRWACSRCDRRAGLSPELLAGLGSADRQLIAGWLEAGDKWAMPLSTEQAGHVADALALLAHAGANVTIQRPLATANPDGRRARRRAREQQTEQQAA
jgi:hypothetical protein